MAFIPTLPVFQTARPSAISRTTTTMAAAPLSRRAALRLAAFSIAAAATSALANAEFDIEELKEDVEELSYDEEVVDVGPDPAERNPTRIKKKVPPPAYRTEEAELVQEEEKGYDAMVAKEAEEGKRLKALFSRGK